MVFPTLLSAIPLDQTVCIWHSFALHQGPLEVKEQIEQILLDASQRRTIYRISLEVDRDAGGKPRLELFTYRQSKLVEREWMANCAIHEETIEWLLPVSQF